MVYGRPHLAPTFFGSPNLSYWIWDWVLISDSPKPRSIDYLMSIPISESILKSANVDVAMTEDGFRIPKKTL